MFKAFLALSFLFAPQASLAEMLSCNSKQSSFQCLVCNCYFESRGEPQQGKIAVAKTVLSRAEHKSYPNNVCKVVYQPWQFSWTRDKHSNSVNVRSKIDRRSLKDCREAIDQALDEGPNGLIFFYNPRLANPRWAKKVKACGSVGNHRFLVPKHATCPKTLGATDPSEKYQSTEETPRASDGGSR